MDTRKRVVPGAAFKKIEMVSTSASTGMGSKLKSVNNSFRTVVTEKVKLGPNQASTYVASPPHIPDGPSRPVHKTRLCNKSYMAEGCNFGEECHFAHGEGDLGKCTFLYDDVISGKMSGSSPPSSLDSPCTAKISVPASLAGAIIGKICLEKVVEPIIQFHESDHSLRDIELKGNFEQVKMAIAMVIELIGSMDKSLDIDSEPPSLIDSEPPSLSSTLYGESPSLISTMGSLPPLRLTSQLPSFHSLDIEPPSLSSTMYSLLLPSGALELASFCSLDIKQRLMRLSLTETGKKNLYLVVYICTEEYMYALYRIALPDFNDDLPQSNSSPVLLCEPVLLLGREFPFGMAFFAFGSRIYILGSGGMYRSRNVYVFDTLTGDFGYAYENMLTDKFLPLVIKPLKPFEDRVFVFSADMCGQDLEVFFPYRRKKSWTFIGGPSWWTYPPGCLVESHSNVLGGFLLLTSNGIILFFNIPSNTWTFRMDSHTYFSLEPRVFAYEMGRWFSYCANEANQDDLVGFLCSYSMDNMSMQRVGESPLLHLSHLPARCKFYKTNNLIYLGNFCFCLVQSGFERPAGRLHNPVYSPPKLHSIVSLIRVDPSASSILGEQSSSYEIDQFSQSNDPSAYVYASFVI